MIKTKKRRFYYTTAIICLIGANLLFFLTIWLLDQYDQVTLDQFIYAMKASPAGANRQIAGSAVLEVGVYGIALALVEIYFWKMCNGRFEKRLEKIRLYIKFRATKLCRLITKRALALGSACLLLSTLFFCIKLNVFGYAGDLITDSHLIEEHYVDPNSVKLEFPEKKRNLVYIFLESMENTFADTRAGAPIVENYIPELTKLAEENVSFSHTQGIGGAQSFTGTTWTAAAMVSQTAGVIVQVPLLADSFGGGEEEYAPGLVSIGEILEKEGYQQVMLCGSDADFGSRQSYFRDHGNYTIVDYDSLRAEGRLPEDYLQWWGFEDEKLFAYAKEEITRMAASDQPFNLTMLTADTHFPDGYVCPQCQTHYDDQYANVLRCSSRQVAEFVAWLQEQPFYENTTIVISGDHLTMDPDFLDERNEDYVRTVYNCIINPAVEPVRETDRQFGVFDLYPTTLAAMGVTVEGDRLGIGTNLFSDRKTLTEEYGFETLDAELKKNSDFYNENLLEMDSSFPWD